MYVIDTFQAWDYVHNIIFQFKKLVSAPKGMFYILCEKAEDRLNSYEKADVSGQWE